MEAMPFEIKSELTETDKSSTIEGSVQDFETQVSRKKGGPRSKYGKPTKENRQALIHKIIHEGVSIRQAAKKVGINYSTAKSIFNLYKSEGRLGGDLCRDDEESIDSSASEKESVDQSISVIVPQVQKKQFISAEETTIKKKDPFTALLFHQLNTVESKPRGYFSSDFSGSQSQSLLSSAFCIYNPQPTVYPNVVIAPEQNNRNPMMMNVIYVSDPSRPIRY